MCLSCTSTRISCMRSNKTGDCITTAWLISMPRCSLFSTACLIPTLIQKTLWNFKRNGFLFPILDSSKPPQICTSWILTAPNFSILLNPRNPTIPHHKALMRFCGQIRKIIGFISWKLSAILSYSPLCSFSLDISLRKIQTFVFSSCAAVSALARLTTI